MRAITGVILVGLLLASTSCSSGEDVFFTNGDVTLAGTLLRPESHEPVPAVVLIHGSGEEDRGSVRYYAEMFVRNGIAALIYDKRGVGKSTGPADAWRYFNFDDLAGDAAAAVNYLAGRADIDGDRIGIFGASQGGWVAPLAAKQSGHASFLVLLSASLCSVADDRLFERSARLRSEGFNDDEIAEVHAMQLVDQQLSRSGEGFEHYARLWEQNKDKRWFRRVYLGDEPSPADSEYRLWYRTVLDFDAVPILEELSLPTLCIFGDPEHDRFGPAQVGIDQVSRLARLGKPYESLVYLGTDHNLQSVDGGNDAPVEENLSRWLKKTLGY